MNKYDLYYKKEDNQLIWNKVQEAQLSQPESLVSISKQIMLKPHKKKCRIIAGEQKAGKFQTSQRNDSQQKKSQQQTKQQQLMQKILKPKPLLPLLAKNKSSHQPLPKPRKHLCQRYSLTQDNNSTLRYKSIQTQNKDQSNGQFWRCQVNQNVLERLEIKLKPIYNGEAFMNRRLRNQFMQKMDQYDAKVRKSFFNQSRVTTQNIFNTSKHKKDLNTSNQYNNIFNSYNHNLNFIHKSNQNKKTIKKRLAKHNNNKCQYDIKQFLIEYQAKEQLEQNNKSNNSNMESNNEQQKQQQQKQQHKKVTDNRKPHAISILYSQKKKLISPQCKSPQIKPSTYKPQQISLITLKQISTLKKQKLNPKKPIAIKKYIPNLPTISKKQQRILQTLRKSCKSIRIIQEQGQELKIFIKQIQSNQSNYREQCKLTIKDFQNIRRHKRSSTKDTRRKVHFTKPTQHEQSPRKRLISNDKLNKVIKLFTHNQSLHKMCPI